MDRRTFLSDIPMLLALAELMPALDAQTKSTAPPADVVDFWVNKMGVPANMIIGGANVAAGEISRSPSDSYGLEPQLFFLDEQKNSLVAAEELATEHLTPSGDMEVDFELGRLRLNDDDKKQ